MNIECSFPFAYGKIIKRGDGIIDIRKYLYKKITASKSLRFRGDYLYDKGENDEQKNVLSVSSTDLQVYFIMSIKKSKEKIKKIFRNLKNNIVTQKMIIIHKFTKNM